MNQGTSRKRKRPARSGFNTVPAGYIAEFVSFICWLLAFSIIWCLRTWQFLKMDELVYELTAPLEGTGGGMIFGYIVNALVPALIVAAALRAWTVFGKAPRRKKALFRRLVFCVSFILAAICVVVFMVRTDTIGYFKNMDADSTFIEDHYADTAEVNMTFPAKKRNLIFIFLESMEVTYADKENGGAFEKSCIPELTKIGEENECFSGDPHKLNGGYVLPGTTWTMGGMFAQTSGLPLKIAIGENMMDTQETFFPNISTMGDVLKQQGYRQVLLLGSYAVFGGRKLYFKEHGNYEMHDYGYAKDEGRIDEDYYEWWGYEDEKLFDFAKRELKELSKDDKPFNLTMLTADTHFEDGYICRLCDEEFGDNQYANVFACSSRQVADFVKWAQKQDFYENTTIVISGDHTTMDKDFCNDVPGDYDRKTFVTVINPAVEKKRSEEIAYSTLDIFPTTLAAMGVNIEGDRLGLGVNLFSDQKTLIEQYGEEKVAEEFKKKSALMETLAAIDMENEELLKLEGWAPDADTNVTVFDPGTNSIRIVVDDIVNIPDYESARLVMENTEGKEVLKSDMTLDGDRSFSAVVSLNELGSTYGRITIYVKDKAGKEYEVDTLEGDLTFQAHDNVLDYLSLLKNRNDCAYLISICGEASYDIDGTLDNPLRELGLKSRLKENPKVGYYAIIDGDNITENMEVAILEEEGKLSDGSKYSIKSVPSDFGGDSKIEINGEDYIEKNSDGGVLRGLDIVVYNYAAHAVVDHAIFFLVDRGIPTCTMHASSSGHKARFSLENVKGLDNIKRLTARGELWDPTNPSEVISFDFKGDATKKLTATVKAKHINMDYCCVKIYLKDGETLVENLAIDCVGNLDLMSDDFGEYLKILSKHQKNRLILVGTKGYEQKYIPEDAVEEAKKLGMHIPKQGAKKSGYSFVLNDGTATEEIASGCAKIKGETGGIKYVVESETIGEGRYSSIRLNDQEFSPNERGFDIVVYNLKTGTLEDRVSFDTTGEDVWVKR